MTPPKPSGPDPKRQAAAMKGHATRAFKAGDPRKAIVLLHKARRTKDSGASK